MSSVPTSIGYMTVTARGVNALASNINAEEMSGTITFTPDVGREPLVAIAEDPKVLVSIDQIVASFDATGALRPPADGKALPITDEGDLRLVAPGQPDNLSVYGWTWTAFFRPGEGQYWRPFAIVFGGLPDETVDLAEQYLLNHPASGGEISSAATVIREGDPRLSDARVPVHHTHSMEDIEDYESPNLSEYAKTIDIPREPSDIGAAPQIALVSGTAPLPATGDPILQFYTTGETTFETPDEDVATFPAGTAVVWRRDPGGAWGYRTVDEWDAPTTPPVRLLADEILALSPTGYWKLDEPGTTHTDYSGNDRHGTSTGDDTRVDGFFALTENSGVTIPNEEDWSPTEKSLTMFALIRPSSFTGAHQEIIGKRDPNPGIEWSWYLNSSGQRMCTGVWSRNGSRTVVAEVALPSNAFDPDEWVAVAATIPLIVTGDERWTLYASGEGVVPSGDKKVSSSLDNFGHSTSPLRIGFRGDHLSRWFRGAIGHVAIFNTVLTEKQIECLMEAADVEGLLG